MFSEESHGIINAITLKLKIIESSPKKCVNSKSVKMFGI